MSALTDQVAVITGGGAGIGRAIALALAAAGADIVIGDIVPDRCEETAARVREMGRRALSIPTDVLEIDKIRALMAAASEQFGRIDGVVGAAVHVQAHTRAEWCDLAERFGETVLSKLPIARP